MGFYCMGAFQVVFLGTENEAMSVSFVKFYFLKGLLTYHFKLALLA